MKRDELVSRLRQLIRWHEEDAADLHASEEDNFIENILYLVRRNEKYTRLDEADKAIWLFRHKKEGFYLYQKARRRELQKELDDFLK